MTWPTAPRSALAGVEPEKPPARMGIEILVYSWNVGNARPNPSEIEEWLPDHGGTYDLVVVGTQENDFDFKAKAVADDDDDEEEADSKNISPEGVALKPDDRASHQISRAAKERAAKAYSKMDSPWDKMVSERLGPGYMVVQHKSMREMRLTIYAKKEHLRGTVKCITGVQTGQSACGIGSIIANKGGLLIKLEFGQTTLAFISCHLAAHAHKLQRRNADCQEILQETQWSAGHPLVDCAHEFDHLFWIGDLNYRIDLGAVSDTPEEERFARVSNLIDVGDWGALMAADQLTTCQEKGEAFAGFQEGKYEFAPTFKVERKPGTIYKSSRIPSYCDRILWKSMPSLSGNVKQSFLKSSINVTTSDHKPVFSAFTVTPSSTITPTKDGALPPLIQFEHASVDGLSGTDRTYLVFLTNPAGLLGSTKEKPSRSQSSMSKRSSTAPNRLTVEWSAEQCPLLRPMVHDVAELSRATLIVAVYDADVLSKDDLLGVALIPLGRKDGAAAAGGESYEIDVNMPLVKGCVSADKGTFTAKLSVTYGRKLGPALESAVGITDVRLAQGGGCCALQ
uniref:Inositol polyphosphate-related phosphatase domain-containing protein n=1 Tax=Haptolina brevifila TaxID=156173 RepID=A0A7S2CZ95_9EUKA